MPRTDKNAERLIRAACAWYRVREDHYKQRPESAGLECPDCAKRFRTLVRAIEEYRKK